jgi:hypothetical protein
LIHSIVLFQKQEEQNAFDITDIENESSSNCAIRIKKDHAINNACLVSDEEVSIRILFDIFFILQCISGV